MFGTTTRVTVGLRRVTDRSKSELTTKSGGYFYLVEDAKNRKLAIQFGSNRILVIFVKILEVYRVKISQGYKV